MRALRVLSLLALLAFAGSASASHPPLAVDVEEQPETMTLVVESWLSHDDEPLGEQAALAYVTCARLDDAGLCTPRDAFAGAHSAPAGQDVRVGSGTPWRSASAWTRFSVLDHDVEARAGTFRAILLQFYYVEVYADGQKVVGVFDAFPAPW